MEEIKRELIKKHLEDWDGLKKSSIEHFAQSGKVSGSFFMALKDMLDDYDNQLRLHNISGSLRFSEHEIDFAYLCGVFNVSGIDGLHNEIHRLKELGKEPHNIIEACRKQ